MKIIIFTTNGHSYIFQNIENIKRMNKVIEFDYVGVQTKTKNHATFINIAGYTILDI